MQYVHRRIFFCTTFPAWWWFHSPHLVLRLPCPEGAPSASCSDSNPVYLYYIGHVYRWVLPNILSWSYIFYRVSIPLVYIFLSMFDVNTSYEKLKKSSLGGWIFSIVTILWSQFCITLHYAREKPTAHEATRTRKKEEKKDTFTSVHECWMRHAEMREMLMWTCSCGTANSIHLCSECLLNSRMLSVWSRYFK